MNKKLKTRYRAPNPVYRTEAAWAIDPALAFGIWLADAVKEDGRPYGAGSIKVYRSMWATYIRELQARRQRHVVQADASDLQDFLDHSPACRRLQARQRYLMLLRRVYPVIEASIPGYANPTEQYFGLNQVRASDKPMTFLSAMDRARVFAHLAMPSDFGDEAGRMRARAKVTCALMLGAGFKPGQAARSPLECVKDGPRRFIAVPSRGPISGRLALVVPQAWLPIQCWIEARQTYGDILFPGRSGTVAASRSVDYARLFLGVRALLHELTPFEGGERASPQTLRNSYGADLIEQGYDLHALRDYMGFSRLEFANRFAHAHAAWKCRVDRPS